MSALDETMGPLLIGVIISAILYGVSLLQVYYYFTHQKDGWLLKSLVAAVTLSDTLHQALIIHTIYSYLVKYYGQPEQLNNMVWSVLAEVYVNGLTGLLVQSFLTARLWRLSNHNVWLTGVAILLVAAELAVVLAFTTIALTRMKTWVDLARISNLSISINAFAAAGDVWIAAGLCTILYRSKTGFHRSDTMIRKLIMFTVNTGALTSVCAIMSLVLITSLPNTFWYILFYFNIGRLYANSLLATLNARKMIRAAAGSDGAHNTSENMSVSLRDFTSRSNTVNVNTKRQNISIKINKTQEFNRDIENGKDSDILSSKQRLEEKKNSDFDGSFMEAI